MDQNDIDKTADAVQGVADKVINRGRDLATQSLDKGQDVLKQGIDALADNSQKLARHASKCGDYLYDYAKSNPTHTVLLSLGLGALLYHVLTAKPCRRRED